jgi:hypothetical protein
MLEEYNQSQGQENTETRGLFREEDKQLREMNGCHQPSLPVALAVVPSGENDPVLASLKFFLI